MKIKYYFQIIQGIKKNRWVCKYFVIDYTYLKYSLSQKNLQTTVELLQIK